MPVSSVWFLGANTPRGFRSLYAPFVAPERGLFYLVKGCPGCGKSTFFRHLSRTAEALGLEQEIILCSGDPNSLDGVYFPALRLGYVDATAPHALEPVCPGAGEVYLDFSRYLDTEGLGRIRPAIEAGFTAYQTEYRRAYRFLESFGSLEAERRSLSEFPETRKSMESPIRDALAMLSDVPQGGCTERYYTAVTCAGKLCLSQTVSDFCPRIIAVESESGLSGYYLRLLEETVSGMSLEHILCPDPLFPDVPAAILFPSVGLGFLAWDEGGISLPEPCRILSPDAAVPRSVQSAFRPSMRLAELSDGLLQLSVESLQRANEKHAALEALYRPYVDFDAVSELSRVHSDALVTLSRSLRT